MAHHQIVVMFNELSKNLFNIIFNDEDSSSDEENEILNRYELIRRRGEAVRIIGYVEITVPRYNDKQFQENFRLTRVGYEELRNLIGPLIRPDDGAGRPYIEIDRQLLSVLWLLATPDSYRSIGCQFNMSKSSLFVAFQRVILALSLIAPQIITWPTGNRLNNIEASFKRIAGVPNVIGAIDGTFVPIKAPRINPEVYITRKCQYALTLQAICDSKRKSTDVFVGYPGSVSDTRIFRNSDIFRNIQDNQARYIPNEHFLIGDKAYPCLSWCIPPYIDRGNLTASQRNFNLLISKTRQTIERTFALLFGRFRRLKYLDMNRQDLIPTTILASCVLHNICLNHADGYIPNYENEGRMDFGNGDDDENEVQNQFNDDINGLELRNNLCERLNNARHD